MDNIDETIYSQSLKIANRTYTVGELLGIDEEGLNEHFSTHAARLGWLGMQMALAEISYEEAKANKDKVKASVDLEVRDTLEMTGIKSTEAKITSLINVHESYREVAQAELQAFHNYKLMRAIVDAMRARGDMLISLGAQLRKEYDATGMVIRDEVSSNIAAMRRKLMGQD